MIDGGTNGGALVAALEELWQFLCSFEAGIVINIVSLPKNLLATLSSVLSFFTTLSTVWNYPSSDPDLFLIEATMLVSTEIALLVAIGGFTGLAAFFTIVSIIAAIIREEYLKHYGYILPDIKNILKEPESLVSKVFCLKRELIYS